MDRPEPPVVPAAADRGADLSPDVEALTREVERLRVLASKDRGLLGAILEHSPHGIIVCDPQGQLILQNRAAERIWAGSFTATDIEGWQRYRAFHPDGRPFAAEDWAMARCLRTREVVEAQEFHIQRFDDSEGYLLGSSAPLLTAEGELQGAISVFADVTKLKEAEAQSQRLQEDLARKIGDLEALASRTSRLQAVTAALARAVTLPDIADAVTQHSGPLFEADGIALFVVDERLRTAELVSMSGIEEASVEDLRRLALSQHAALDRFLYGDDVLWIGSRPEWSQIRTTGGALGGLVVLPLRTTRRVLGLLVFGFSEVPTLDDVGRDFFLTLASHCSMALERAVLYDAEREANERLKRQSERLNLLAHAGETLSSSLDSREALAELARLVVPTIADWCGIDELDEHGQVRRLAIHHRDPARIELARRLHEEYPPDPNEPHGVPRVLRTGEAEFVAEIPDALLEATARDARHLELARSLRLASYAIIPLKARGRVLGALSLVTEGERRLTEEDVQFSQELGRRAALALDNARLYESESTARAQLHGLFMGSPAAISIVRGPERRFALANAPYTEAMGGRDLVGQRLDELTHSSALADLVHKAYDSAARQALVELRITADRQGEGEPKERFFHAIAEPTFDLRGQLEGVATFAFEVTDQVRARNETENLLHELARSELRMRALVEATAAIVWTATSEGDVAEPSPSWLAFTGQTEAEYLGGGLLDAIHPDDRAVTMEAWRVATGAGAAYAGEYRLRRGDGTYAHTLARARPVVAAGGEMLGYIGCNIDVTDLRAAEAQAREHADTLATINELGKLIAAELDTQRVVQAVTDAATELTGAQFGAFFYNVEDEKGARYSLYTISGVPREHFSKFPLPRNTAVFAPTFEGRGIVRVDDITADPRYGKSAPHYGMPPGHLPVRSYLAVPVRSRLGEVIGGIFLGHASPGVFSARNETLVAGLAAQASVAMDNSKLFGEAQRLIKALEATNRELDQFAYVTSHDLKAPLRGIGSLASWIEEDLGPELDPELRRKLNLLQGRVRRMEGLIQGILDYSRAARSQGRTDFIEVSQVVADIIDMFAPAPPAQITTVPGLPVVRAERIALQQVFMNLIGNALKHAGRADVHVHIDVQDAGDAWQFRVRDNGPGIATAFHDRIWGIFQTLEARDKVENTGIGLAIVRKIVENHGGRAWVESTEGQGAVFAFTWPKADNRSP